MFTAKLPRSVFRLSGEGVSDWLSGLITNTLSDAVTFAALLTPQGKIIADFFIYKDADTLLLDTPTKFAADLHKRLRLYRLRAPIEIEATELSVYAVWEADELPGQADPRLPALGNRVVTDREMESSGDYNAHRLSLGVPDSEWDFETAKVFPADANMDLLNGVNFSKGCFVGQEVVSRMKRMTTVKKRMRGIVFEGDAKAGDKILSNERVIGDVLHTHGNMGQQSSGMAMIRLDRLREAAIDLTLNDAPVQVMNAVDGIDHLRYTRIMKSRAVEIRRNDPNALPRFAALNAEWIADLHYLEESDKLMVARPEIYTQNGNHVFSAHIDGQVAGVCALKKHDDGRYELTKMAVDMAFRGNGVGQHIMTAVEAYAKTELDLDYLFLLSNTRNAAALRLYARNGWTVNHEGPHPVYDRANIGMEKHL